VQIYGQIYSCHVETDFAILIKSRDPDDVDLRPRRLETPVYTSTERVEELLEDVGPHLRILKLRENTKKLSQMLEKIGNGAML